MKLDENVKPFLVHITATKSDGSAAGTHTQYFKTRELADEYVKERLEYYQSQGASKIVYYHGVLQEQYKRELQWIDVSTPPPKSKKPKQAPAIEI